MLVINGPQSDGQEERDPNGLYLNIESWPNDGKYISFNTISGLVYIVEQSANLVDWSDYQTIVANDTKASFFLYDESNGFFRVRQLDDRIQFPDWDDWVEQFAYFDVYTTMQGTYTLELYADGQLVHQMSDTVPSGGRFGLYDGAYNPANWPNEGFYDTDVWTLHVTVTPFARSTSASATVQKKFRKPYNSRSGLTVQQYNAFTVSYLIQDEIDDLMLNYFLAGLQVTPQYAFDASLLDWSIDRTRVPRVQDYPSWANFRFGIYSGAFSDLHYFGHGAKDHLGSGQKNTQLEMWLLDRSRYLATNHMRYVALDGCNTAEETTFLGGWTGHDKKVSRDRMRIKGWLPRFGWGWTDEKGVAYTYQGSLLWAHFNFVTDYYTRLTHRDLSGTLVYTYEQAIDFGKHPNGQGINPNVTNNSEGNTINYVGCYNCYFDQ